MAVASCSSVELGFVEDVDDKSEYPFPSHVGGKPHWINPKQLPDCGILTCKECKQPLLLLLQLFVPLRDANSSAYAYQRMIYVFTCVKASCHRAGPSDPGMVVLRTQLPRENPYYPPDVDVDESARENPYSHQKIALEEPEPDENTSCLTGVPEDVEKETESTQRQFFSMSVFESHLPSLCAVCGCPGSKRCGGCRRRNYCSKLHQIHHWKNGHQLECSSEKHEGLKGNIMDVESILFQKMDLVTESEPAEIENKQEERTEEERMKEYRKFIQSAVYKKQSLDSADELSVSGHTQDVDPDVRDKQYKQFRERVQREPEQVLRLQRGGEPLWVVSTCVPAGDSIPVCSCGSRRIFEFQILPQLLYFLKIEQFSKDRVLDWGTLAVYTCQESCQQNGRQYVEEFIWKQDFN